MKKFIRTLSMLVCMALLMTGIPVQALAEALAQADLVIVQETPADTPVQPDAQETEAQAPAELEAVFAPVQEEADPCEGEPREDAAAQESVPAEDAVLSEQPAVLEEIPAIWQEPDAIDYSADAGMNPAFVMGYAQIGQGGAAVYAGEGADAPLQAQLGAGVVYALARSDAGGRLEIAYNAGARLETGWADAACLRPMNPADEVPAYLDACAENETALAYGDAALLCAIDCSYPRQDEPQTETEIEGESDVQEMTFLSALAELNNQDESASEAGAEGDVAQDASISGNSTPSTGAYLTASTLDMSIGTEYDLAASGIIAGLAEGAVCTYESSDEAVLAIDEAGVIRAAAVGAAVVSITVGAEAPLELLVTVYPVATEISLQLPATLGVGSAVEPVVSFPAGSYAFYTVSSSHPEIIGVEADGSVKAHQQGSATITAATSGGLSASVEIAAIPAPETISISNTRQELFVGEEGQRIVAVCPEGAMCGFIYESSDETVAAVDANGNVQARGVGEAVITVTADNNPQASARCTITVYQAPTSLRLSTTTLNIGVGDSFDMKALLQVDEGSKAEYTFSTGNAKYASVTDDGIVTGLKRGMVYINAKTQNGLTAQLLLCVHYLAGAAQMSVSPAEITLSEGMQGKIAVSFSANFSAVCKFASSDADVATVESDGTVTATGRGEAVITVSLAQNPNIQKSVKVYVKGAPETITASTNSLQLGEGQVSTALKGVCPSDSMCDFTYASSDENVAKVDASTGAITAVGAGTATITITASNNPAATAKCEVTVAAAPTAVTVKKDALTIGWGDSYDVSGLFEVAGGSADMLTYASSHPAYVSVNSQGVITGMRAGLAFITASTYNGLSARILVTSGYIPTANRIAFSPASLTLGEGTTGKFTVWFASGYGALYTLSSSDEDVATVDADGNVTAVGAGTATITASLVQNPSVKKSAVVTVKAAPEAISVSRTSLMLNVGQTSTAVYGVNPNPAATSCSFTYASTDETVATVDPATGAITAVGVGRTDIIVSASNNPAATAKCTLTVVKLDTDVLYLGLGDVCDLKGRILHPDGPGAGEYTFASSNWRYVTATADGKLTALRPGSVWVTVASNDGLWQRILVTVRYYPIAGTVSLSPAQLTLGEGMKGKINVNFVYGYAGLYTLTSSREDVARVDAGGNITAVAPGETVITATLDKNPAVKATATVQVLAAPETITASETHLELGIGQVSTALNGVCPPGSMSAFTYSSSDGSVARVDASTGVITAVGRGEATITITSVSNPSAKASCTVSVKPAPASLRLSAATLNIGVGDSFDMKDLIQTDPGSKADFTFSSGNWKYASVTADGIVTGLKRGMVYINVKTQNGLTAQLLLCIHYLPNANLMSVSPAEIILSEGMQGKVNVGFYTNYYGLYQMESSDEDVATVENDGTITATGKGDATITVSLKQKPSVQKSVKVSVKGAPETIAASATSLQLGVGQVTTALKGVCPDDSMCAFIYASSDESVAKVDASTGAITAVGKGTATITITADNNPAATASCEVTVAGAPTAVTLNGSVANIGLGDSYNVRHMFAVKGGSVETLNFTSSHPAYISVDSNGMVTGLRRGAAFITASTYNGLSAQILVYCFNQPTASRMVLSPAQLVLGEGMTGRVSVQFASGYYGLCSFSSDDTEVATVDASTGAVTAVGAGTATIRASLIQNPAVYKTISVKVVSAPESITATKTSLQLGVGQVSTALQGVCPADAMCSFIYTSSNESVAKVDAATGAITAVGKGIATVTVAANNNPDARAVCRVVVLDAPLHMELAQSSMYIGYGDSYDLKQLISSTAGSAAGYTFSTTNKNYVSVTEDGIIRGLRAGGIVNITVRTHNGLSDIIKVSVMFTPTLMQIKPKELTLGVGMQETLAVSFNSIFYYSVHSFTSSDADVAAVDMNGRITALKPGKATITVETFNGLKDSVEVTVAPGTEKIEFAQTEYSLSTRMQLPTQLVVDEGSLDAYIYKSSDENVVTIDANGVLTGVKKGTATIEVSTVSGVRSTQTCTVTVTSVPHTLDFNGMPEMVIAKGYSANLPQPYALDEEGDPVATTFTYSFPWSLYANYAKIEGNTIRGLVAGKVLVRATSHNGLSIDFAVRIVNDTISGIELDHSTYALYINAENTDSVALNGRVVGSTANFGAPSYKSSDEDVATVSADGIVTAVGTGTATITAEAYTGITATCEITVGTLTSNVAFASEAHTITAGDIWQLTPVFDENTGARMAYESSDKSIAVVDGEGNVTAIAPGTATITGTAQHGLTAQLNLKVRAVPTGIRLKASGLNLAAGESVALKPEILTDETLAEGIETDTSVTYSTTQEGIAQVDADGTVTAIAPGQAVITAVTRNGLTASCTITVLAAGSAAVTEFAFETATMILGDSAALEFNLSKVAYECGFTIQSSDEEKLQVDEESWTITALGAAEEGVELTLTVNPPEDEIVTADAGVSCTVKIIPESKISFSAEELILQRGTEKSSASLEIYDLPEDLIGTFELFVEDEAVATYDAEAGLVQAMDLVAETRVICRVFDREIACAVKVVPAYRALIISEFNNSKESSDLPFAQSNVDAMYESLYLSLIDGQMYDITVLSSNPTQAQIQSTISRTFADAREGDVSLVYIVSHGYYNGNGVPGYCFGTPGWSADRPDSYITAKELYGWLDDIQGNVVLMLDSCKSGGFILDNASELIADGNIAVITAQVYNKNASYFIKADGSSIEFLTYALCWGLGYDYENGVPTSTMAADANRNGEVTITECFQYAKSATTSLVQSKAAAYFKPTTGMGFFVPGVWSTSALKSWGGQVPQTYIPASMANLVIYEK